MNPQKMTDSSGTVVWDRVATPFNVEVIVTGALTQPLKFPGQFEDTETALFQNWHRDYDASLGRYVQSDPIGLMGGINTYAYVEVNPLTRSDVQGLDHKRRGSLGRGNIEGSLPNDFAFVGEPNPNGGSSMNICGCGAPPPEDDIDVDFFFTDETGLINLVTGTFDFDDPANPISRSPTTSGMMPHPPPPRCLAISPSSFPLYKAFTGQSPQDHLDSLFDGSQRSIGNSCFNFDITSCDRE